MVVEPTRVWMRRISARISRRSLASRFESGSSIRTSGGSMTTARAMATRCCCPPVSCSKPARQLSAVDLPQPDGPSRAMNSPRPTLSVTSRSAFRLPKSRLTPSSCNSRKSRDAAIMPIGLPSLGLRAADLLIPATERIDQLVRRERQLERIVGDQLLVFWPTELLDDLLALRRRHRQRHVLHRRAGIEIAAVIGRRLRLLREQIGQEIDEHRDLLGRHALGDAEIIRIHD